MANVVESAQGETVESEAEDAEKKALAARNVVAQVQYGQPGNSSANPRNSALLKLHKHSALGTASESRASKLSRSISAPNVPPPAPLKLRTSVPVGSSSSEPVAAPSSQALSPGTRPRLSRPAPAAKERGLFGSCFGAGPPSCPSGKPSAQNSLRKPPPHRSSRLSVTTDLKRPGSSQEPPPSPPPSPPSLSACPPETTPPEIPVNRLPPALEAVPESDAQSGAAAAAAPHKSPLCRCPTLPAAATGSSTAAEPAGPLADEGGSTNSTGADAASMKKVSTAVVEADPGISSGQQVLNAQQAQSNSSIAAEQISDPGQSSRQAEVGSSPIRGLRPDRRARIQAAQYWGPQGYPDHGQFQMMSSPSQQLPYESYENYSNQYNRENFRVTAPGNRPATARGVARLFDSIIGPGDFVQARDEAQESEGQEDLCELSRTPSPPLSRNLYVPRKPRNKPAKAARNFKRVEEDHESRKAPIESEHGTSSANVEDDQDQRDATADQPGSSQVERDDGLLGSEYRWPKRDPLRPVEDRDKRDQRRRGYPDPSFNPRPGDIIIRARKRSGLRLTDFYYYDNENYMEEGDQILRAKFEYLPPMDTMYLWCRLYVYGNDGGYTYLDSTSEVVGKFRTGGDIRTFKQPGRFM